MMAAKDRGMTFLISLIAVNANLKEPLRDYCTARPRLPKVKKTFPAIGKSTSIALV